jgi:hypothetical protein
MKRGPNMTDIEREMILALLMSKPPLPYSRIAAMAKRSYTTVKGIARANGFCGVGRLRG